MISVSAPGKLMFSGEWSVLEKGNPAIVFALDRKVKVQVNKSKEIVLHAPEFGISKAKAFFDGKKLEMHGLSAEQEKEIVFLQKSIEVALYFLKEKKKKAMSFSIETESSQMLFEKTKMGFGSSAAVCVAAVYGVCFFHGVKLKAIEVFKLATMAHFLAQGKIGSGFDVAASAFGGMILYNRFDPAFVEKNADKSIAGTVEKKWPWLEIKKINLPKELRFLVVFSGKKADTRKLVSKMNEYKKQKTNEYANTIKQISYITSGLVLAFAKQDKQRIIELVNNNREKLRELGKKSGTLLELPELREIIETAKECGCAAKFCGAGGGDSAIVVSFDKKKLASTAMALKQKGFRIINTRISQNGVKAYA